MTHQATLHPTLADRLLPWENLNRVSRNVILALLGSFALTLSAKVQVPFYPVPMTMQTFVVLALGMALGWRLGMATVILYLVEGASGLPVFSGTPEKGLGLAYMFSTTGGYLFGFVLAAGACGWLAERGWDRGVVKTAAVMVIGNAIIYAFGLLWLGGLLGWDQPIIAWGLMPFLLGDAFKVALAAGVLPLIWRALGQQR